VSLHIILGLKYIEKFHDYSTTEHVQAEIAEQVTNVTMSNKRARKDESQIDMTRKFRQWSRFVF
jgi:hypothetical protein